MRRWGIVDVATSCVRVLLWMKESPRNDVSWRTTSGQQPWEEKRDDVLRFHCTLGLGNDTSFVQRVDTVRVHARLRVKMRVEATRVCCRSFVYTRGTVLLGLRRGGGMKKRYVVGKSGKRVTARREIKAEQRTRRNKGEANKGPLSERE